MYCYEAAEMFLTEAVCTAGREGGSQFSKPNRVSARKPRDLNAGADVESFASVAAVSVLSSGGESQHHHCFWLSS